MVSLAYYLRVIAAVWMRPEPAPEASSSDPGAMPAIAGAASRSRGEGRESACWLVVGIGLACAAATVAFGVAPSPLVDWASHAAGSLTTAVG